MTADPHESPMRDLSARADIEALLRDVPVMTDIDALAVPGFFADDAELEEFWSLSERIARPISPDSRCL